MKPIDLEEAGTNIKNRTLTVRFRAWLVTGIVIAGLVAYTFIVPSWGGSPDYIVLGIIGILQIVMHIVYFAEGENFGSRDKACISNKNAYNEKASKINEDAKVLELREYCEYDFEKRKQEYIKVELGAIGITEKEFSVLRQKTQKEILHMKSFEFEGRLYHFTKVAVNRLYKLIFLPLPIKPNTPELILNAVENTKGQYIVDKSKAQKAGALTFRVMRAVPVAIFLAYIGYEMKDGVDFGDVVRIFTYFASIVIVAVSAFIKGETNTKVYKNEFYIQLSTFIDGFNEWLNRKTLQEQKNVQ